MLEATLIAEFHVENVPARLRLAALGGRYIGMLTVWRDAIPIDDPVAGLGAIGHQKLGLRSDRKSTRLNSSHEFVSRMPSSA